MENARSRFEAIVERSKNLGVETSAVIKLQGAQKLFSLRKKSSGKAKRRWCLPAGGSAEPVVVIFLICFLIGSITPALGPAMRLTFRSAASWWWGSDVRRIQVRQPVLSLSPPF